MAGKHSSEVKLAVVQEVIESGRAVAELAAKHQIGQGLIYSWLARYRATGSVDAARPTSAKSKGGRGRKPRSKPVPGEVAQRALDFEHPEKPALSREHDRRGQVVEELLRENDRLRRMVKALQAAMAVLLDE